MQTSKSSKALLQIFFFLFICFPAFAAEYEDYLKKGERNIKIIERLSFKYPLTPHKRRMAIQIRETWENAVQNYPLAAPGEKKLFFRTIKEEYAKSGELLKDISIDLANLYDLLYDDLAVKFYSKSLPQKVYQDALARYRVSNTEKNRAAGAYRNRQYYFSSHVYDRAVTILLNIYTELSWEIPAVAKGVILE